MTTNPNHERQILGRVKRDEFVGRTSELQRVVAHATHVNGLDRARAPEPGRGLLVLLAPLAGVSELLRQAYDELFNKREVAPIFFALPETETTAVSAAIEFLTTFLMQYIGFRRDEPSLCRLSLTLNELIKLAPSADLPWIEELVEAYKRQRFCRRNHVFGVAAIERNSRGEQGLSAGKKLAVPAVIAITAVAAVPANADALASFPRLYPLAHAINHTNDFMSGNTRILNTWPKSFLD